MIIGIDIDDVLAQFNLAFDQYHNEKFGTNIKLEDHFTFNMLDVFKISRKECTDRLTEFFLSDHHSNMPPFLGAQEALLDISKKHKIEIITSRLEDFNKKTVEWLQKHYPDLELTVHHANHYYGLNHHKKSEICKKLGVNILIDDALEFAEECAELGIKVLLLDSPWNQKDELDKNITRVKNWKEILEKINEMEKK